MWTFQFVFPAIWVCLHHFVFQHSFIALGIALFSGKEITAQVWRHLYTYGYWAGNILQVTKFPRFRRIVFVLEGMGKGPSTVLGGQWETKQVFAKKLVIFLISIIGIFLYILVIF